MEDENKKKTQGRQKKERVEGRVCALVRFVKKRDPRVRVQVERSLREQAAKEIERKKDAEQRKKDLLAAKEVSVCTCESAFFPNAERTCILSHLTIFTQ